MQKNNSIKIYWVALVWAKWQIILPNEAREDFLIETWKTFFSHNIKYKEKEKIKNIAFSIYENEEKINSIKKCNIIFENETEIKIWTKFQFVIPVKIRNNLEIIPWNSLIVVGKKWYGIWFIKNDKIDYLFKFIKEEFNF